MKSSYRLSPDSNDGELSVEYKNIYLVNGEFQYLTLDNVHLPDANTFTNTSAWKPIVKTFQSQDDITNYITRITQNSPNMIIYELCALCSIWWGWNIGHALFDGFYPIYLALVKFSYEHSKFYLITDTIDKNAMITDIIDKFSGNPVIFRDDLINISKNQTIYFKTLVVGTGNTGNRVINTKYTLYGQKEFNALTLFKQRIYSSYDISYDKLVNYDCLKVAIIDNIRYSKDEISVLHKFAESMTSQNYIIKYIKWNDYKTFGEQLNILKDIDIQITGPGTGMMYTPFIKKGGVNINLGYMERTQTNHRRPNIVIKNLAKNDHSFPGWMEQSVCSAADYMSNIYYDRTNYNTIEYIELILTFNKALKNIYGGFIQTNNHNYDAKIFIEYCNRVDKSHAAEICKHLTGIAFFIELFVCEHPSAITHNVDLNLLREIKNKYGYNDKYTIKKSDLSL